MDKRKTHKIPTGKLVNMAESVLKNNYIQFSNKVYQQISGREIGTQSVPLYAYMFMDKWKFSSNRRKSLNLFVERTLELRPLP